MVAEYGIHPDCNLVRLFSGYQGQYPGDASLIFIGYDANWPENLLSFPALYKEVLEYLMDPIAWLGTSPKPFSSPGAGLHVPIHHPLLHESNSLVKTSSGIPYHRNINKLRLSRRALEGLSFLELLRWPTVGRTGGNSSLLLHPSNRSHLEWINSLFCCCMNSKGSKLFIVPRGMLQMLSKIGKTFGLQGFKDVAKLLNKVPGTPMQYRCDEFIALTHFAGGANPKARIEDDIPLLRDIVAAKFGQDMVTD